MTFTEMLCENQAVINGGLEAFTLVLLFVAVVVCFFAGKAK